MLDKLIKIKTIYQKNRYECGLSALAMVLRYYGENVSISTLRNNILLNEEGCSAKEIVVTAREYGFKANGIRMSQRKLLTIKLPYILLWNNNHYVVYMGTKYNYVYINDPAQGVCKFTKEEFGKRYCGLVLSILPNKDKEHHQKLFSNRIQYLFKFKKDIKISILLVLFNVIILQSIAIVLQYLSASIHIKFNYVTVWIYIILYKFINYIELCILQNNKTLQYFGWYREMLFRVPIIFFAYQCDKKEISKEILFEKYSLILINYTMLIASIINLVLIKSKNIIILGAIAILYYLSFLFIKIRYKKVKINSINLSNACIRLPTLISNKKDKKLLITNSILLFIILLFFYNEFNSPVILTNFYYFFMVFIMNINSIFFFYYKISNMKFTLNLICN